MTNTRILPQHEQHYPEHLLPHRLEEYVLDDGRPPTMNRGAGVRLTGERVLTALQTTLAGLGWSSVYGIDPRYFVATCFHESGVLNEWDTEVASPSCPEGFVSVGPYQIGREEAQRFGFTLEDMLDLGKATECMLKLASANRGSLRTFMAAQMPGTRGHLPASAEDPGYTDPKTGRAYPGGAMRFYLAIAHNKGCGYARKTIGTYGMDVDAYIRRNPTDNIVAHNYGIDCITGGPYWPRGTLTDAVEVMNARSSTVAAVTHTGEVEGPVATASFPGMVKTIVPGVGESTFTTGGPPIASTLTFAPGVGGVVTWGPGDAPTPAPKNPRPVLTRVLKLWPSSPMRGLDVEWLQQRLNQGVPGEIPVTGVFDKPTELAVRAYQQAHWLVADGVVGPVTWDALGGQS